MKKYTNPKTVLIKAADLIRSGRWIQGFPKETIDGKAHYCAVGAINRFGTNSAYDKAVELVDSRIRRNYHDYDNIIDYNDREGRTHIQVANLLEKVAKSL